MVFFCVILHMKTVLGDSILSFDWPLSLAVPRVTLD